MNTQGIRSNQSRKIGCGALTGHDGKGSKQVAPGHPWKIPLKAQGNPLATASSQFQSELPGKKEIDVHQSQTLDERCSNGFLHAAAWNLCVGLEQLRKEQGCLLPLLANDFLKKLELLKTMEDILQGFFNQLAGLEVPKETGILTNLAEEVAGIQIARQRYLDYGNTHFDETVGSRLYIHFGMQRVSLIWVNFSHLFLPTYLLQLDGEDLTAGSHLREYLFL